MNDGGCVAVSPLNSEIIFCAGNVYNAAYFVGVSHSSDGGTVWEHDTIPLGTRGWAVAFDPLDTNRVYVGGDSAYSHPALLITTDCGTTWTQSRTGLSGAVNSLATVPGNSQLVYAGTNSGVFRSTDAGATWSATGLTTNTKVLVVDPGSPNTVYAGTYGQGVSVSTDGGATWNPMNSGLINLKVLSLSLRPGAEPVLYAGTEGGAVYRTALTTGVVEGPGHGVVAAGRLPTIVRGSLILGADFCGLHSAFVMMDASGRKVAELAPGENNIRRLSPGVYFVRTADEAATGPVRKVVIQ